MFGPDILVNPTFGSVYVLLWVGLVPAALLFGRVYRLCNPLRWLHRGISRLAGIDPHQGLFAYPRRLGYWPAAFFLFCFVWFELVDPQVTTSCPRGPQPAGEPRQPRAETGVGRRAGGAPGLDRRRLPNQLAHCVVPIVVGYFVAHYLSYLVAMGIQPVQQLGDPLSRGWQTTAWLSGIDKYEIYNHPTALAVTKVVAIVVGHVLGVIAAHDRAVRLLPKRHALVGQLPMLVLMVGYTLTGLLLLFSS